MGTTPEIVGEKVAMDLRKLRDDETVKAVVLRVNSPGGSAFASEQIWNEVVKLKEKKPVIVSMGGYAASGGYYIAAPGDAIIADRMTITGSIGVFGMFVDMGDALCNKLGITVDERIADGVYFAKTIKIVKKLLANPELLELPVETPVEFD